MKSLRHTTALCVVILLAALCAQAQDPFTNGLVAYYSFEGNANDVSGNANNAAPAGNYQFVSNGLAGSAIRIIGDGSVFYSGGGHVMLPTFGTNMNSGYSLSLWVKDEAIGVEPVGAEAYITFQPQNVYPHCQIFLLNWSPPRVSFEIHGGPSAATFDKTVNMGTYPNAWKHLVLVSDPGRFACYFDGEKIGETNAFFNNIFPPQYAALGRHWWDTGSSTRMSVTYDNVRIYRRALSDQEVLQLYNIESSPLPYLTVRTKTIRLSLYVELGKTYQLEASTNMQTWSPYGSSFTAVASPVYEDVDVLVGSRFFRIREVLN